MVSFDLVFGFLLLFNFRYCSSLEDLKYINNNVEPKIQDVESYQNELETKDFDVWNDEIPNKNANTLTVDTITDDVLKKICENVDLIIFDKSKGDTINCNVLQFIDTDEAHVINKRGVAENDLEGSAEPPEIKKLPEEVEAGADKKLEASEKPVTEPSKLENSEKPVNEPPEIPAESIILTEKSLKIVDNRIEAPEEHVNQTDIINSTKKEKPVEAIESTTNPVADVKIEVTTPIAITETSPETIKEVESKSPTEVTTEKTKEVKPERPTEVTSEKGVIPKVLKEVTPEPRKEVTPEPQTEVTPESPKNITLVSENPKPELIPIKETKIKPSVFSGPAPEFRRPNPNSENVNDFQSNIGLQLNPKKEDSNLELTNGEMEGKKSENSKDPEANESARTINQASSKDTTILICLFAAVVVIGGTAFGYNHIKKRRASRGAPPNPENGNVVKRSLQNLTGRPVPENPGQEMKPLINGREVKDVEYREIAEENDEMPSSSDKLKAKE